MEQNNAEDLNKQYNNMVLSLDEKTLINIDLLLKEELDKFTSQFLGCKDVESLYKLQGNHFALTSFSNKVKKLISQKKSIILKT